MARFLPILVLLSCTVGVLSQARSRRTERSSLPSAVGRLLEVPLWARRAGKALTGQKPSIWGRLGCLDMLACVLGATVKEAGGLLPRKTLLPAGSLQGHQSAFANGLRHGDKTKCRLAYVCSLKKGTAGQATPPTTSEPLGQPIKCYKKKNAKKAHTVKKD